MKKWWPLIKGGRHHARMMWPGSSIGGNSNWPEARYLAPALEINVCFHLLVAARAGWPMPTAASALKFRIEHMWKTMRNWVGDDDCTIDFNAIYRMIPATMHRLTWWRGQLRRISEHGSYDRSSAP